MMSYRHRIKLLAFIILFLGSLELSSQVNDYRRANPLRENNPTFFKSDEARRIGDQLLLYQRNTGGWPKNVNMIRQLNDNEKKEVLEQKTRRDDSTIDNNATTMQMAYLGHLYQATKEPRYKKAFLAALEFLLDGQYENGGWPQFWPITVGYQKHITYNDDAMVNILNLFKSIENAEKPYDGDLVSKSMRKRLAESFDRAISCILRSQIQVKGELTVWCQQHNRETLEPTYARAYELPSFCSQESASLVRLLMTIPKPNEHVKKAIHAAMKWFDTYKLTGLRYERTGWGTPDRITRLVEDTDGEPLWARFYDLECCEPYVCDRDGIPRRYLEQIGSERRHGYGWYGTRPAELYPLYEAWADKYDKRNKVSISLQTKGANETGLIELYRKPAIAYNDIDAIVNPGESIQKAIELAPLYGDEPYVILLRKGEYNQKIIIDRPNIVLVGEERDSTIIYLAECGDYKPVPEYHGKPAPRGVISLTEEANDCVLAGFTVYNNYGTTVERTTAHQFAVFGRATRTIVVNCNIQADGNDALALWAKGGDGMYYHADLNLHCPGVDFLCPRGWCYATRCNFYGDGRAMIWHDGRGDKSKKLVITDSYFDAKSPTVLGRYHHDSQFYLSNCRMAANVLDQNISYAYTDKVLDPCPWGFRVYYYGCSREGGHGGWLKNNLNEAENAPEFHGLTATWTFGGRWNPEKRLRELWSVIAY